MYLTDFSIWRPEGETPQQKTIDWLVAARSPFSKEAREEYTRVASHGAIEKRGHISSDQVRSEMLETPLQEKMAYFQEAVKAPLEALLPEWRRAPDDLIHVTCTGYTAPSAAERLVAGRGWGERTAVTHLYHKGCYAALSAIRVGRAFAKEGRSVDIVHTECCTLHLNPRADGVDQRVIETLFGDGFVRYSIAERGELKILSLREELIGGSEEAMSWTPGEKQFQMTLSREVPLHIVRNIDSFLERLGAPKSAALFAIHPGGPKIIDALKRHLGLSEEQIFFSREVLKECGNISSATLPHIWKKMLDAGVKEKIVSLAFGPGLTVAGGVLCGGS